MWVLTLFLCINFLSQLGVSAKCWFCLLCDWSHCKIFPLPIMQRLEHLVTKKWKKRFPNSSQTDFSPEYGSDNNWNFNFKDNFKGISSCVCMFMDYNFDFIVTKAYFDKLEITNIINKYNQKKHDITGKNSTVGSLCNNMGIPTSQVYYVLCGRHIIQIFHPTACGVQYLGNRDVIFVVSYQQTMDAWHWWPN